MPLAVVCYGHSPYVPDPELNAFGVANLIDANTPEKSKMLLH
jgi:hypothetical protein